MYHVLIGMMTGGPMAERVEFEVECEVCGEVYADERDTRRWTKVTWVVDAQGREEGVDHCVACDPAENK